MPRYAPGAQAGGKPAPTAKTPNPQQPQLKQRASQPVVSPKQAQTINMMESAKQALRKPAIRPTTGGGVGSVVATPTGPTNVQGGTGAGGGGGGGSPARPQPLTKPAVQPPAPPPASGGTPTINFDNAGPPRVDTMAKTIPLYASNPGATADSSPQDQQALYNLLPPRMRATAMAAGRDPQEAIASRMANDPNFARVMAERNAGGAPMGPPAPRSGPIRMPQASPEQQPINFEEAQMGGRRLPGGGADTVDAMGGGEAGQGFNPSSLSDLYQQLMPNRQPKLYGGRASYGVGGGAAGPGSLA